MTSKAKLIITIIALIVVVGGGTLLYNRFIDKVDIPDTLQTGGQAVATTPDKETATSDENLPSTPKEQLKPGDPDFEYPVATDVAFYTIDGEEVLLSDFYGKSLVVNFWASWCPPCKMEMPHFQEEFDNGGEDITFLMISMTGGTETQETAEQFINESGYTFPVYHDLKQNVASTYFVSSLPTSMFINANGQIVAYQEGALSSSMLKRGIAMITLEE